MHGHPLRHISVSVAGMIRSCHRDARNACGIRKQRSIIGNTTRSARRPARSDIAAAIEHQLGLAAVRRRSKQVEGDSDVACHVDDKGCLFGWRTQPDGYHVQGRASEPPL